MIFRSGEILRALLALAALLGLLMLLTRPDQRDLTGLAEVIDGDSLRISGEELRLKGIDAPELTQSCERGGQVWECGKEARFALRRLAGRGLVTCIGDARDRYGRLLVACRAQGVDINAEMVKSGMAVAYGGYLDEEKAARDDARGLWAGRFDRPQDWRKAHPRPQ